MVDQRLSRIPERVTDLVSRFGSDVRALVARSFRDEPDLADDVEQEVWIRVVASLGSLRAESDVRYWILGICRHVCVDSIRREQRTRNTTRSLAAEVAATAIDKSDDESRFDLSVGASDRIDDAVVALPTRMRAVAFAHFWLGKPPRAIAHDFGLASSNVRKLLSQSRRILRRTLHGAARARVGETRFAPGVTGGWPPPTY